MLSEMINTDKAAPSIVVSQGCDKLMSYPFRAAWLASIRHQDRKPIA